MSLAAAVPPDVDISAHFELAERTLRVGYELSNRGSKVLAVYDGAGGQPNEDWPDLTENIYISFQEPDAVLLKRVRAPVPKAIDIESVEVPAASRLEPGQTRQVHFSLSTPLAEFSEYFPEYEEASWKQRRASSVQLWIGYFVASDETIFTPLAKRPDIFRIRGRFGTQRYAVARQDIEIRVRVRTDPVFERV